MNRLFSHIVLPIALAFTGCQLFESPRAVHYETVRGDPQHDTKLAEEEHKKALKLIQPTCPLKCENWAKAEDHLQKALVADIAYGPAHNTLGMLYFAQRKLYLAAWEFEYAVKLMPDHIEPLFNLGMLYEEADKLDRAIEYYNLAFAVDPKNPAVLGSLARARLRNGDSVAEVRPLLKELLFYETRPAWICWARDQLGLPPEHMTAGIAVPPAAGASGENTPVPKPPQPEYPRRDMPVREGPAAGLPNGPKLVVPDDTTQSAVDHGRSTSSSLPLVIMPSGTRSSGSEAASAERLPATSDASANNPFLIDSKPDGGPGVVHFPSESAVGSPSNANSDRQ